MSQALPVTPPGFTLGFPSRTGTGCLLIHGFSGAPHNLAYLARRIADAGHGVVVPALAGHEADAKAMAAQRKAYNWAPVWQAQTKSLLESLTKESERQVVIGFSMGSLLTTLLAAQREWFPNLSALVLLGTPLLLDFQRRRKLIKMLAMLAPDVLIKIKEEADIFKGQTVGGPPLRKHMTLGSIESLFRVQAAAQEAMPRVRVPVLAIHARNDHTAPVSNVDIVRQLLHANPPETVILDRSYHVIPDDIEREQVADAVVDFIQRRVIGSQSK